MIADLLSTENSLGNSFLSIAFIQIVHSEKTGDLSACGLVSLMYSSVLLEGLDRPERESEGERDTSFLVDRRSIIKKLLVTGRIVDIYET